VTATDPGERKIESQRGLEHPKMRVIVSQIWFAARDPYSLAVEAGVQVGPTAREHEAVSQRQLAF